MSILATDWSLLVSEKGNTLFWKSLTHPTQVNRRKFARESFQIFREHSEEWPEWGIKGREKDRFEKTLGKGLELLDLMDGVQSQSSQGKISVKIAELTDGCSDEILPITDLPLRRWRRLEEYKTRWRQATTILGSAIEPKFKDLKEEANSEDLQWKNRWLTEALLDIHRSNAKATIVKQTDVQATEALSTQIPFRPAPQQSIPRVSSASRSDLKDTVSQDSEYRRVRSSRPHSKKAQSTETTSRDSRS